MAHPKIHLDPGVRMFHTVQQPWRHLKFLKRAGDRCTRHLTVNEHYVERRGISVPLERKAQHSGKRALQMVTCKLGIGAVCACKPQHYEEPFVSVLQ